MTITTRANGEQVNLATVLNSKLEAPILQSEMGLDAQATATKQAVRWDEFSAKHNNDGTFKTGAINQVDVALTTQATATQKPVRWDEFSNKHNNDGTFKTGVISNTEINLTASATATGKAIRWDEFSARHNNTGTVKQQMYNKSQIANPSATANTYGTAATLTPPTNYTALLPLGTNIVFGGTFGSETATARITVTFSDATTLTLTKTATATGTTTLSTTDFLALTKDGLYITQVSCDSQSTLASSTATVTFNRYGMYI